MRRFFFRTLAACCICVAAVAHHSAAMFDHSQLVVLTGTVKSFSYQAPHSWISMLGAPQGETQIAQWDAETGSPAILVQMGITQDSVKPGDKITLAVYPLRDGRKAGALVYIETANGHLYGTKPEVSPLAKPQS